MQLPNTWIHESDDYARIDLGRPIMEFRLTYQGPLYAAREHEIPKQARLKHKHDIRKQFHIQLSELWKLDSRLAQYSSKNSITEIDGSTTVVSGLTHLYKIYESHQIKWVPLVNDTWGVACALDIPFLRHEAKGGIVHGGDLDNRIKTLFDALTIPQQKNEIPDDVVPQSEPDPFYCLLSNDRLIAEFRVTSDRLLLPEKCPVDSDVHLVIGVKTFVADRGKAEFTLGPYMHE